MKPNQTKIPLRFSSFAILFILFFGINFSVKATHYYSKSTGNLELTSSWTDDITLAAGNAPANFTTSGDVFNIRNNAFPTVGANWTVSGGMVSPFPLL
jgi:hypothetical protein